MSTVHELPPNAADSEKITINRGYVDLGTIDSVHRIASAVASLTLNTCPA